MFFKNSQTLILIDSEFFLNNKIFTLCLTFITHIIKCKVKA